MRRNVQLNLSVNGETVEASFAPYKTLLEVLREDLRPTGTKHGCELGECGACAVLVDGEPRALLPAARASSATAATIETVEGLADGAELHPLQAAFADLGAAQCGYCTPGILMTAEGAARRAAEPHARRDPRGALRQSLPLHRLPADLRGDRRAGERCRKRNAARRRRRSRQPMKRSSASRSAASTAAPR